MTKKYPTRHMCILIAGVCVCAALAIAAGTCYCQEDVNTSELKRINGWVTSVDTFNSIISVKWQGSDYINYNETTFKIPEGMQFRKGTDQIDIFDINIDDPVTIEFYTDNTGATKIKRMDVSQ